MKKWHIMAYRTGWRDEDGVMIYTSYVCYDNDAEQAPCSESYYMFLSPT